MFYLFNLSMVYVKSLVKFKKKKKKVWEIL